MKNAISLSSILGGLAPAGRHAATTFLNSMLRPALLMLLACLCLPALAQKGEWTWMGGSNSTGGSAGLPGVYGVLGTPSAANIPGGRAWGAACTDNKGNLWLLGGIGYDSKGIEGLLNDLWKFSPSTTEWTWLGGSKTLPSAWSGQPGVYGALGTFAAKNVLGNRAGASCWIDSSGDLWFFGGTGSDANGTNGEENDLWEFNPATREWAWMSGSSTVGSNGGQSGVYGSLGVAAAKNSPGGRRSPPSWTDSSGHFWLFGGWGFDAGGGQGWLNDLWEFNPSTREWTWVGGSSTIGRNYGQPGVYGKLGIPAEGNIPGARFNNGAWGITIGGNFWLYGGEGADANGNYGGLNDLWEFNPSTREWAWMSGGAVIACSPITSAGLFCGLPGKYGTLQTPAATNVPGSREDSAIWVDQRGNLWVFGGGGYDANNNNGNLNDLWEYSPSTGLWVWMGGPNATNWNSDGWNGVYGTKGSPAAGNLPGGRNGGATWTDASGDLWLFGGIGVDASGNFSYLGDLWEYQPAAPAAKPAFSVASGTYTAAKTVSIADSTPKASIFYTLNGALPATQYTKPLTIAASTTVVAVAAAPGYSISPAASASYEILKTQTITFPQPTSPVTYGVKPITLSATASSGLAVSFSVVSGPGKVSGATLTITGAGTVVVAANQPGNAAYAAAPQVTRTIVVNKAALTVTANNQSMKAGAAVPTLTYATTGFVNGDTQAKATTGAPKLPTTATSKSAVGSYPITVGAGTLAAGNYSFAFVNGTLTVTK